MFRIVYYITFLPLAIGFQQIDRYDLRQARSDYIHKFFRKSSDVSVGLSFLNGAFFSLPQYLLILLYRSSVRFL